MVQCVFFTTPSMPMRCYVISRVGLTTARSAMLTKCQTLCINAWFYTDASSSNKKIFDT